MVRCSTTQDTTSAAGIEDSRLLPMGLSCRCQGTDRVCAPGDAEHDHPQQRSPHSAFTLTHHLCTQLSRRLGEH